VLEKDADMLAVTRSGETPLLLAAEANHISFIETLLGLYEVKYGVSLYTRMTGDEIFDLYEHIGALPQGEAILDLLRSRGWPDADDV
jgi:hypothetical protein